MTGLVMRWIGNSVAILIAAALFDGVSVATGLDAFLAGAVLGIINSIVKPVLVILTLPVTILSLGLFYVVISAFCLWLTSGLLPGFSVHGAFTTMGAALLVGLVSAVITNSLRSSAESERR